MRHLGCTITKRRARIVALLPSASRGIVGPSLRRGAGAYLPDSAQYLSTQEGDLMRFRFGFRFRSHRRASASPKTTRPVRLGPLTVGATIALAMVLAVSLPTSADANPACTPTLGMTTAHFKVWYCDKIAKRIVPSVATAFDAAYAAESTPEPGPDGLGQPLWPGPDGHLDVYVLPVNTDINVQPDPCSNRPAGVCLSANVDGVTIPAATRRNNFGATVSSAVVVVDEHLTAGLGAVAAHEFFHVLEDAHSGWAASAWIGEASATWAQRFYGGAISRSESFKSFQMSKEMPLDTLNL